jgi:hypothetical protein
VTTSGSVLLVMTLSAVSATVAGDVYSDEEITAKPRTLSRAGDETRNSETPGRVTWEQVRGVLAEAMCAEVESSNGNSFTTVISNDRRRCGGTTESPLSHVIDRTFDDAARTAYLRERMAQALQGDEVVKSAACETLARRRNDLGLLIDGCSDEPSRARSDIGI